jgi:hypothetical protein
MPRMSCKQHEHVAVAQTLDRQRRRRLAPHVVEQRFAILRQIVHPIANLARAHDADVMFAGIHALQFEARRPVVGVGSPTVYPASPAPRASSASSRDVEEVGHADVARSGRKIVDEQRELLVGVLQMAQRSQRVVTSVRSSTRSGSVRAR